MTIEQLIQAHQWTALSAAILTIMLGAWRRWKPVVWDRVPTWAQPIALLLAAGIPEYVRSVGEGSTWWGAVISAVVVAATAEGVLRYVRALPGVGAVVGPRRDRTGDAEPPTKPSGGVVAGAMLLCVLLAGCQPVKAVSDVVRDLCGTVMVDAPEVKAQAQARGIDPWFLAGLICAVNDAVNPFLEIQQRVDAAPPGGPPSAQTLAEIQAARANAIAVARAEGILR